MLGFGQRIGAFLLDWVLRCQYEEGAIQFMSGTAYGDLPFLHGFKKSGLGFGRGTVDFICKNNIGKQWALKEFELAPTCISVFLDDFGACDVGGHKIGGELDSTE